LIAVTGCDRGERPEAPVAASGAPFAEPQKARDLSEPEYGEFYARPEELAPVPVNDIVKSMRLNATAMSLGQQVYIRACASCHGADLQGIPSQHAPNLTDADWRFAGDDLATGGATRYPSDVEWTVRYGIRSGNPNARGLEADMVAFDPARRSEEDKREYGNRRFLTAEEIGDVVEYVLQIGRQEFDGAKAARGDALFHDATRGNCADCHGPDGTGDATLGSTNLTRPDLYLWGSDRAAIAQSVEGGRHGTMPAFDSTLKPEEIKAVAVYVFSRAAH
jgi:cytochrome c oxidase cbb3-type subunit 3